MYVVNKLTKLLRHDNFENLLSMKRFEIDIFLGNPYFTKQPPCNEFVFENCDAVNMFKSGEIVDGQHLP